MYIIESLYVTEQYNENNINKLRYCKNINFDDNNIQNCLKNMKIVIFKEINIQAFILL